MSKIPVIMCIDVEPDAREIDCAIAKDWEGFEKTLKFFNDRRPRFEEVTGGRVNFSWFFRMDPQIEHTFGLSWWVAQRYREAINQLELAGDEIGLHTHAWRWEAGLHRWIADHGDQKWINHCIRSSFGAYRSAFGRPCLSFRFGDHWMNDETMDLLESLGVKFDLTVEPGREARPGLVPEELHRGSLPDYTATPTLPYRPSRQDFRKPGDTERREMWLIPLSTDKGVGRFARLKRAAKALGIDLYEADQLNLRSDHSQFRAMMNSLLNVRREPYLAPVIRTDALLYSKSRANIEQNINSLLSHSMGNYFQFVGPAEAIKLLKKSEGFSWSEDSTILPSVIS